MFKLLHDTLETYAESANLILLFGVLVFAIMMFLASAFTFTVAGAGFLRYDAILSGEIGAYELAFLGIATIVSIFTLAFFVVAITLIVKLRRSMDDIGFRKLMFRFPKYTLELMTVWLVLGGISLLLGAFFSLLHLTQTFWTLFYVLSALLALVFMGLAIMRWEQKGAIFTRALVVSFFFVVLTFLSFYQLSNALVAWIILCLWAFFIFVPQTLILGEDKGILYAMRASASFFTKKPVAILSYYLLAVFLVLFMITIEVILGQSRIFWLPQMLSAAVSFLFGIPVLEILKVNIYLTRYKLLLSGLK